MTQQLPRYFAYLLRIWRADGEEVPVWRASIQSPGGEMRQGFAGLDELFEFLRSQVAGGAVSTTPTALSPQRRERDDERRAGACRENHVGEKSFRS